MRKIKISVITLIIALAVLGGAYALWYDSLYINETVDTGQLQVRWCQSMTSDPNGDYFGTGGFKDHMDNGNPAVTLNLKKNIGSTNAPIDTFDTHNMSIELDNTYPGYQENVISVFQNIGTVPVKIQDLQPANSDFCINNKTNKPWLRVQIWNGLTHEIYYDSQPDASTTVVPIKGKQVDPGQTMELVFVQRVLDDAPQNFDKTTTFQMECVQWNSYNFDLSKVNTIQ